MKRHICAVLLMLMFAGLVLLPVLSVQAQAGSGSCGGNVTWSLENNVLTISGTGPMANYFAFNNTAPWYSVVSKITDVVIEEGVTEIGEYAFTDMRSLERVSIPASLQSIHYQGFNNCGRLRDVYITDLNAWMGIDGVSWLTGLHKNAKRLYLNGEPVTDLVIPEGTTEIGKQAFYTFDNIETITIPDSVTQIAEDAFHYCSGLWEIVNNSSASISHYYAYITLDGQGNRTYPDESWFEEEGFLFTKNGDAYQLRAYLGEESQVKLPQDVNGNSYTIYQFRGAKNVVLPEGMVTLGYEAFSGCKSLESISLPASLTMIGNDAFWGCERLVNIHLADLSAWLQLSESESCGRLTQANSLKKQLYLGGELVTKLTIPEGAQQIGRDAFCGFSGVEEVIIPDSVTQIGVMAFASCPDLDSVTIGDGVTKIGGSAFENCEELDCVTIGKSVEAIGSDAFRQCKNLYKVINRSQLQLKLTTTQYGFVTYYAYVIEDAEGKQTFMSDAWLEGAEDFLFTCVDGNYRLRVYTGVEDGVTLPKDVNGQNYEIHQFLGAKRVVIPEGMTNIGYMAFCNNEAIEEVTIPNSVTTIDASAFCNCANLEEIRLPDGLQEIGRQAFYGCKKLERIEIPASLIKVGESAFWNCDRLQQVHISDLAAWCGIDFGSYDANPLYIAKELFCDGVQVTELVVPEHVKSIGTYAFAGCDGLTSVTIPNSVNQMGAGAFSDCSSLEAVYISDLSSWCGIAFASENANPLYCGKNLYLNGELVQSLAVPSGVQQLGDYCFIGCGISQLSISDTVTAIGTGAFMNCDALVEVAVPAGVLTIGNSAFAYCDVLKSVALPATVTKIGTSTFAGCPSLETVQLREGLQQIGAYAFLDCAALQSVQIPNTVTTIGEKAFYGCRGIGSVTVGTGVEQIGANAFSDCSAMEAVYIADLEGWCNIYFANPTANPVYNSCKLYLKGEELTELVIPETVSAVGQYAFYRCQSLTQVTIPDQVTEVGKAAFRECTGLRQLDMGAGLKTIGEQAFYDCKGLAYLAIGQRVETISMEAFAGCSGLIHVDLGTGVDAIGYHAFYGCSNLSSVVVPAYIDRIGEGAFYSCGNLWHVLYRGSESVWQYIDIRGSNTSLTKATRHYDCKGDEIVDMVTVSATCAQKGSVTRVCTICEAMKADVPVPEEPHNYGQWEIEIQPTCSTAGNRRRVCAGCGFAQSQQMAAGAHAYEQTVIAPDCVTDGYTMFTCGGCGDSYQGEIVPALGHTETILEASEATCIAGGLGEGKVCATCGQVLSQQEVIPATGHAFGDWQQVKAPTETEKGLEERLCAKCGEKEQRELEKLASAPDGSTAKPAESQPGATQTAPQATSPAGDDAKKDGGGSGIWVVVSLLILLAGAGIVVLILRKKKQ